MTARNSQVERVDQRLEELRRSFDDDIRCAPPEDTRKAPEYLLLTLAGEAYAYPVMHALEVLPAPPIVPVPGMPPAVLGIINFRGQILSVTTIHGLLGLTTGESAFGRRIIVTKDLPLVTGILVDSVEKIAEIAAGDIQPLPLTVVGDKARLLVGQVYVAEILVSLLDVTRLCGLGALRVDRTDTFRKPDHPDLS